VNLWAHEVFRGGGHMNASGGELFGSVQQAVRLFEQTFPKYLKKD
jgi:phosphoesterase RecJ-like protein